MPLHPYLITIKNAKIFLNLRVWFIVCWLPGQRNRCTVYISKVIYSRNTMIGWNLFSNIFFVFRCDFQALFMHRSSPSVQLHAPVQVKVAFLHLHLLVLHPVLHPQDITSMHATGSGVRLMSFGLRRPSSVCHPQSSGAGKTGFRTWAWLQTKD